MKQLSFLLLSFILFLTSACTVDFTFAPAEEPEEEIAVDNTSYPNVDEALWVYFQRFEEEGRARGIEVDLRAADITGKIEALDEDDVAGQCTYNSHFSNHVTIDQAFWNRASDRMREFVVFHELGHCDLGRDHREAVFSNGTCQSMMRSGLEDCRDNYTPVTRPSYLDELFDPQFRDELGP